MKTATCECLKHIGKPNMIEEVAYLHIFEQNKIMRETLMVIAKMAENAVDLPVLYAIECLQKCSPHKD